MSFPSGGQELEALADHGVADLTRREVWASEIGSVLVEEEEEGEGDEGDKEEKEGEVDVSHVDIVDSVFVLREVIEGFVATDAAFYRRIGFAVGRCEIMWSESGNIKVKER